MSEIQRLKKDINLKENGYPLFWSIIRPGFNKAKINRELQCPMNYLYYLKVDTTSLANNEVIPIGNFFVDYKRYEVTEKNVRINKKVEALIQKYRMSLRDRNEHADELDDSDIDILMESKFEELIDDIRQVVIPQKYKSVMIYLINAAFRINTNRKNQYRANLHKNKSILMKTLYDVSPKTLLSCFTKNMDNNVK